MTAIALAVIITVTATLFAKETLGWLRRLSETLVRRAIKELPDDIPSAERARWEAEVLADLESFSERPISGIFHALQVRRRGVQQLSDVLASNDDLLAGQEREDTTSSTAERHFHPTVLPTLDRSSDVPLYFQLAAALKAMLEVEVWEPGARFASEREIEEEFNVSRAVIRPALDLLVGDGAIFRVRGSGAFVAPSRSEVRVVGLAGLWLDGMSNHQTTVLSVRKRHPDRVTSRFLEVEDEEASIAHVIAVMDVGGTAALIDSYSSIARAPWLISIAEALVNGEKPPGPGKPNLTRATVSVEYTFFGKWHASQVGAGVGDPALVGRLVQFGRPRGARREQPLEFARIFYRADATGLAFDTDF